MIIHDVIQGTPEWAAARAGIPTASNFSKIITGTGKASISAGKYQHLLLAEIMMGKPSEKGFKSESMKRGNELEDEAADYYCLIAKTEVQKVGFVTDDMRLMGASPDRLVGDEGLLEIKAPDDDTHVGYLLDEDTDDEYKAQLQGQLLVTGRKWVDIITYHPLLPSLITRVERDEMYLATMRRLIKTFHEGLNEKKARLIAKGYYMPAHSTDELIANSLDAC